MEPDQAVTVGPPQVDIANPIVCVHARALLADDSTSVAVLGDLREPEVLIEHPQVRQILDFTRPVAVLLVAVLHFITDREDPVGIVARLRDALVPGSYLVLSHATGDFHPEVAAKVTGEYDRASAPLVLRTRGQIERLFDGFELVAPGLVQPELWRPDSENSGSRSAGGFYSGIGRKY